MMSFVFALQLHSVPVVIDNCDSMWRRGNSDDQVPRECSWKRLSYWPDLCLTPRLRAALGTDECGADAPECPWM